MKRQYLVVYAKSANNFSGFAPDISGCISSGDTLEEMRTMLTEALTFHLEGTAEDGDPIPESRTIQVEFTDADFEGVEYFVVEHLSVKLPEIINSVQRIPRPLAVSA